VTILPEERLERLERVLAELVEVNDRVPVIVEGTRDRDALVSLGLKGEVPLVNVGRPLSDVIGSIAREHGELVVLTDWDRKGQILFDRLSRLARSEGLRAIEEPWRRLRPLVRKDIQAVEDLPTLFAQLRGMPPD